MYNVSSKKVFVSRDLVVEESSHYDWDRDTVVKKQGESTPIATPNLQKSDASSSPNAGIEHNSDVDMTTDSPILKTRSLAEVYEQCNFALVEPPSYEEEACQEVWISAMEEELAMINKNDTWELIDRPEQKNVIGVKWVYRTKFNPDGSIFKHKARLVVKGYFQQPGVDFGDTFAPVATPLVVNEKLMKDDSEERADPKLYRSLIGSLLYLTASRPDVMFAASLLSRYMQSPSIKHFGAAKRC